MYFENDPYLANDNICHPEYGVPFCLASGCLPFHVSLHIISHEHFSITACNLQAKTKEKRSAAQHKALFLLPIEQTASPFLDFAPTLGIGLRVSVFWPM